MDSRFAIVPPIIGLSNEIIMNYGRSVIAADINDMRLFQNCSIRRKLTAMTMITSGCALLFACGSSITYEFFTYRNYKVETVSALADAVGATVAPGLAEQNQTAVEQNLANLSKKQEITRIGVYSTQGTLVAGYDRHGRRLPKLLKTVQLSNGLLSGRVPVVKGVQAESRNVGYIMLEAEMREPQARLQQHVAIILAVLTVSSLAAYLLSCRLQRMISGPVLHLARTARTVSTKKDYSIRAQKHGDDEIGLLIDGFNQMLAQIQQREADLQEALDNLKKLEVIVNRSHAIAFLWSGSDGWSVEFVSDNIRQLGYSPDDFTSGRVPYSAFVHPDDLEQVQSEASRYSEMEVDEFVQQYRVITKSGEVRWMDDRTSVCRREDGSIAHYQGLALDITDTKLAEEALRQGHEELETRVQQRTAELADTNAALQEEIAERKRAEVELLSVRETLQQQATHDPLTGLPNRLLFSDRLNQQLARAHRTHQAVAVMFVDLDKFKEINDTLGHDTGDMLLRDVSDRLSYCVREADTLARMGGDEFTIILSEKGSEQEAVMVGQRVIDSLSRPFLLDGREMSISASVGISLYPAHGSDVETLVKNADRAMYHAKQQGRNQCQVYAEHLESAVTSRENLAFDLGNALERNEFILHYQPRVDIRTGKMTGGEALLRWRHPKLGMLYPDKFMPVAEAAGLMPAIDEWAVVSACRHNRAWQDKGIAPIEIAVNMAEAELRRTDLPEMIQQALSHTMLDPRYLTLEFTERALMADIDLAKQVMERLKKIGISVSIDDFGSTNSSLTSLRDIPAHAVKIDRASVRDITANADTAAIAQAIVAVAHDLSKLVVAEGVETLAQLELLRSLNCDEMQGYFISKPAPAEVFEQMMKDAGRSGSNDVRPAA